METLLRRDLVGWLRADAALMRRVNAIEEESPLDMHPPWIGIAASASADWSTKTESGREVRIALELLARGQETAGLDDTVAALERRIAALPAQWSGYRIVHTRFLRSRVERRDRAARAALVEYRFRILATPPLETPR